MKITLTCTTLGIALGMCAAPGMAATDGTPKPVSIGVDASTLGLGAQVSGLVCSHAAIRVGYNAYNYSHNGTSGSLDYDGKLKLQNTTLAADLYPSTKSTFHISVGVVFDNNKVTGHGKSDDGTYTINGSPYPVSTVGTLNMDVGYSGSTAPYVGIGWGKPAVHGRVKLTADFGAMFMGGAHASLTSSNPNVVTDLNNLTPGLGTSYSSDIAAQERALRDDANKIRVYPVATIGLNVNF